MDLKQLENDYILLKKEIENIKYHIKLMQMMLPEDTKYMFFQYVITMNLSETEVSKILKPLTKMNAMMKGRDFPDELYTASDEPVLFDASVPVEQWGKQFVQYINDLFRGKVNVFYLLKACNMQGLYPEVCAMLIEQIE